MITGAMENNVSILIGEFMVIAMQNSSQRDYIYSGTEKLRIFPMQVHIANNRIYKLQCLSKRSHLRSWTFVSIINFLMRLLEIEIEMSKIEVENQLLCH